MRHIVLCFTLLLATIAFAQQGQPPPTTPPYRTPPTFPEGRRAPGRQMPPDIQAPPTREMSNHQIEGQLLKELRAEPELSGTNVDATVDDNSVVLTGSVDTVAQRERAVRIAQSYAGSRKLVDKIKVRQPT